MTEQSQSRWQRGVAEYAVLHLRLRQIAELVRRRSPQVVVDLGCAGGAMRSLLPGVRYVGCDFVAPPDGAFEFVGCDFNREALPDALPVADVVACSGVLEYVEDLPRLLAGVRRKLAPGGALVGSYFNMGHVSRAWARMVGRTPPQHADWRGFHSLDAIRRALQAAGLGVTALHPMSHGLGASPAVSATVDVPLSIPRWRPWSPWLAHQFLFVAEAESEPVHA